MSDNFRTGSYYHYDLYPVCRRWQLWEIIQGYRIWCREDIDHAVLWNITQSDDPPDTSGGYYDRDYLLHVKGLKNKQ